MYLLTVPLSGQISGYLHKTRDRTDLDFAPARARRLPSLFCQGVTRVRRTGGIFEISMAGNGDENDWDHLNQANWRGLGLTDPIKSVEVRSNGRN